MKFHAGYEMRDAIIDVNILEHSRYASHIPCSQLKPRNVELFYGVLSEAQPTRSGFKRVIDLIDRALISL